MPVAVNWVLLQYLSANWELSISIVCRASFSARVILHCGELPLLLPLKIFRSSHRHRCNLLLYHPSCPAMHLVLSSHCAQSAVPDWYNKRLVTFMLVACVSAKVKMSVSIVLHATVREYYHPTLCRESCDGIGEDLHRIIYYMVIFRYRTLPLMDSRYLCYCHHHHFVHFESNMPLVVCTERMTWNDGRHVHMKPLAHCSFHGTTIMRRKSDLQYLITFMLYHSASSCAA